jgi:hypothetical protein
MPRSWEAEFLGQEDPTLWNDVRQVMVSQQPRHDDVLAKRHIPAHPSASASADGMTPFSNRNYVQS